MLCSSNFSKYNNINNQLDAKIIILLRILISSTCFGQSFCPSSGALDCVYSLWYKAPAVLPAGSIVGALYHNLVLLRMGEIIAQNMLS